ncbi:cation transporter [Ureaplasma canigenitalium]|uniref:cation transporter n=1 Tax=Ureaplasma canigenitalium TaxID=42092 RepID=UPI0004E19B29|nr:cation transporter [Ureaplasma canigenitalium]
MTYLLLTTDNISCGSCAGNITDSLKLLKLNSLNINILSKEIEVEFDENLYTKEDVLQAMKNGGFDSTVLEEYKY